MKLAVSFIAATAVAASSITAALAGTVNAAANAAATANSKPMLRASIPLVNVGQSPFYGSIDGQAYLEGTGITHELSRNERLQVASCFINSYNDVYGSTDYNVFGMHIKMSHYHGGSATATVAESSVKVADEKEEKEATPRLGLKRAYNTVSYALDWSCSLCGHARLAASTSPVMMDAAVSDTPPVPPLNNDFVVAFQSCLTAGGYNGLDKVKVGLFAPTVTFYLDPPVMSPLSYVIATKATSTTPSAAADVALANFETTKLGNVPMESDIVLYGLVDELSETDEGIVAQCFIDSYNQQFQTSDWQVDGISVEWATVIGGDVNYARQAAGAAAAATAVSNNNDNKEKNVKGFSYLLMDVAVEYACSVCDQDKPQEAKQDHVAFEGALALCLTQSGSTAFDLLESLEVRNMLSVMTGMEKNSATKTN